MHNVNLEALGKTIESARENPAVVRMPIDLGGEWQTETGAPQFRTTIPYPKGEVELTCDFPPPMGGNGAGPSPLAYCFWGGLACYAMTFATEAAREGIELRGLRGTVTTEVDMNRALGLSGQPPVERLDWRLDVESDATPEELERIRQLADARCPGAYCLRNPINLVTSVA